MVESAVYSIQTEFSASMKLCRGVAAFFIRTSIGILLSLTVVVACAMADGGEGQYGYLRVTPAASTVPRITVAAKQAHDAAQTLQSHIADYEMQRGLWHDLVRHFRLEPQLAQPKVKEQISWFLSHREMLQKVLKNAKPYLHFVLSKVKAQRLPAEFALLPMIESGYDPEAYSRAGAAGIWQMMPATAATLGIKINWWYDGRKDITSSTVAALKYIVTLHNALGQWGLVLASYDAGIGVVKRAIAKNKQLGLSTAYWALDLPDETLSYLPRILALPEIIRHSRQYGIEFPAAADKPYFSTVALRAQLTVDALAQAAGVTLKAFRALNPGIRRYATEPKALLYLAIPLAHLAPFKSVLSKMEGQKTMSWGYHQVRARETWETLAKNYHTTVTSLQQINAHTHKLRVGEGVLVPMRLNAHFSNKVMVAHPKTDVHSSVDTQWRIKKDDSLKTILNKLHGKGYV